MQKRAIVTLAVLCACFAITESSVFAADRGTRSGNQPAARRDEPAGQAKEPASFPKGTVVFHGGFETDRRDGGRPVILIAAALGIEPQVFRDAFSNVRPSRNGPPSGERARANKQVLMAALGRHGVTNDRLDEVSNYYRYQPQAGELWKHVPAEATAVIKNGKVVSFKLTRGGSSYSSAPRVEVVGYPNARIDVTLEYGTDLKTNGRIKSLRLVE